MTSPGLAVDCTAGEILHPASAAFGEIVTFATPVTERQVLPVACASGRVLANDVATQTPLPPFDNSAVDGYGMAAGDVGRAPPFQLAVVAEVAAGARIAPVLQPGEALRLFTGAPVPHGVAAVVLEERCRRVGNRVTVTVPVPDGANIRRRGEDVARGSTIVDVGTLLDARHVAILMASGVNAVEVRRPVRVGVLSNGNELCDAGTPLDPGQIHDANRPMLSAMLASPRVEVVDLGCHRDDAAVLAGVFANAAGRVDVIISSGGVAGSEADHIARAVAVAGGSMQRFRLALKPGKPILAGCIGRTAVLGLPGNPLAAMVNFLMFGRALVEATAGLRVSRPRGQIALTATPFAHAKGRTEFVPARIQGFDASGRALLEKLGRGGSARLRPLVLADGFAEIPAAAAELEAGAAITFHPFRASFAP